MSRWRTSRSGLVNRAGWDTPGVVGAVPGSCRPRGVGREVHFGSSGGFGSWDGGGGGCWVREGGLERREGGRGVHSGRSLCMVVVVAVGYWGGNGAKGGLEVDYFCSVGRGG